MPKYTYELFDGNGTKLNEFTSEYDVQATVGERIRWVGEPGKKIPDGTKLTTTVPIYQPPGYENFNDAIPNEDRSTPPDDSFVGNLVFQNSTNTARRLRVTRPNGDTIVDDGYFEVNRFTGDGGVPIAPNELITVVFEGHLPPTQYQVDDPADPQRDDNYPTPWQN